MEAISKTDDKRSIRSGKAVSVNNVAAIPNGGAKAVAGEKSCLHMVTDKVD